MAKKAIFTFDGFDELVKKIEAAGGKIDATAMQCAQSAGKVMEEQLRASMRKKQVDSGLINRMPAPEIERDGNQVTVRVGFKKGNYDPKNPSDGYKATFINYGTPRIKPRGFVVDARRKARPKIKKAEEETLQSILGGLSK